MKKVIFFILIFVLNFSFIKNVYAALPTSYSSVSKNQVTIPKNQGSYKTCTSFSTLSCIETELIKNNNVNKNIDLSEYQLAYFMHNRFQNQNKINQNPFNTGIDCDKMQIMLSNEFNITTENKINYNSIKTNKKLSQNDKLSGNVSIENSYKIKTTLINIKESIIKYGSVMISFYYNKDYYNKNKASYNLIQTNNKEFSHAVTIVGWDDNYSKNNFKYKPQKNGAWLVKNSWGTNWGNKGYFRISYECLNLSEYFYIYDATINKKYNNRYEYDSTYTKSIYQNVTYQINTFTAEDNEVLSEVMFHTLEENCNYKVYCYNGNFIDNKNINNAVLIASGNLKYQGFHTVELSKKIILDKNKNFSIIIELKTKEGKPATAILDKTNKEQNLITKPNRSYIYINGNCWLDLDKIDACCRVKSITQEIMNFKFNKTTPSSTNSLIKISATSNLSNKKQFCYKILSSKNKVIIDTKYINNNSYNWKPKIPDTYVIKVYCKDLKTNKIYNQQKTFKIIKPKLTVTFNKKSPQKRKTNIIIKAKFNLSNKVFRFRIYNSKNRIIKDSKITKNALYTWKPTKKGIYKIKIYCKDLSTNKVYTKTYKYKIK